MRKLFLSGLLVAILVIPVKVLAFGEIFKIETEGTQYCLPDDSTNFNAKKNVDVWVLLEGPNDLVISPTPLFDGPLFFGVGDTFLINENKFALSFLIQDPKRFEKKWPSRDVSFAAFEGTATLDEVGGIVSIRGMFINNGLVIPGCFSSGRFKTREEVEF